MFLWLLKRHSREGATTDLCIDVPVVCEEDLLLALQHDHVTVIHLVGGPVLVPARRQLPPLVARHGELEEVARAAHDGARLAWRHGNVEGADQNLPLLVSKDGKLHR